MAQMIRRAWPTMTLTLLALLGVLGVLLLTGASSDPRSFVLSTSPASQSIVAGETALFRVDVTASGGFRGEIELSVTAPSTGLQATLNDNRATLNRDTPTVSLVLTVQTSASAAAGSVGIGLTGRSGHSVASTALTLLIEPADITNPAPPPPPLTGSGDTSFGITGAPRGVLRPGLSLPIQLYLTNPNRQRLTVSKLSVQLVSTSKPACRVTNFAISQYAGHYPLAVPANQTRTLAQLGIPEASWPRISMLNLPFNQDACKGVTVNLRYLGTGSGS